MGQGLKVIALVRKKAGMSQQDFEHYYNAHHAPLVQKLLPGIIEYRRNFANFEGAYQFENAAPFDFDVVTEIRYRDRAAYEEAMRIAALPDVAQAIANDEEQLFERSYTRQFVVQEARSDL